MMRSALISDCGRFRYTLSRRWTGDRDRPCLPGLGGEGRSTLNRVCFIGLNPSTADGTEDDATVRRWIGYATAWGYTGFDVVNLFAWRATQPKELLTVEDPVGPRNDYWIGECARRAKLVVCCWGSLTDKPPVAQTRVAEVYRQLKQADRVAYALKLTQDKQPAHVLRLRRTLRPVPLTSLPRPPFSSRQW